MALIPPTASIALLGNYIVFTFVASSDGHGGTSVIDAPTPDHYSSLAVSQHA